VRVVIMGVRMQAREERGEASHGLAVIDTHPYAPANFEEALGQQKLRGSSSALLAVHCVCGE